MNPPACGFLMVSEPVRRLLGLGPHVDQRLERAHFYLAGGVSVRIAAGILALGALWFGWCYLRDGARPSLAVKVPLLVLRLCALAALLAVLLQPMLRIDRTESQRSNVVVLVDESQSMGFTDPRLPADRARRIAGVIGANPSQLKRHETLEKVAATAHLIPELAKRYNVRLYRFGAEAHPIDLPADTKQVAAYTLRVPPDMKNGTSTQIGAAIHRAANDVAGQPVAGTILLTDGGNNLGEDPVAAARSAMEQGVRISAMGFGDPTPTKDLAITEVLADHVVRKDGVAQVYAGIAHRGYAGRTITVTLRRNGTPVGTQIVKLGPESRKQTVAFTYVPKQTGTFAYTVSTEVLPMEVDTKNNSRGFIQQVVGKKLRILYVESEPRWEYRYLKNAILRDTQVRFSCILTTAGKRLGGEGNVPIYAFPEDEKGLFDFDILILGDVPKSYFSDAQIRNIRRFVEDKGGSVIAIAGEKHFPFEYKGTSLEAVLPVEFGSAPDPVKTVEPFRWEITPLGRQDPLLRLSEDPVENARIWSSLPGMYWSAGADRAKPGATALAVNPISSNPFGKRILLAVQSFGAGRCYMSMVDSTWRWRWRVGDRYFYRYWGQVLRAMTPHEPPGGNQFAQINADRSEYMLGDRISLHARLLDSFYRPVKANQVSAALKMESGGSNSVTLRAVSGSPGLYAAELLGDRIGRFDVSVASPQNPAGRATASWLVQNIALEQQQPEMNEPLLKQIAAAGGGRYYTPDQLRAWMDSLKAGELKIRSESEVELWDAPLFLSLFIVPLALEWLIRKRTGLL